MEMDNERSREIRRAVMENYATIAEEQKSGAGCCCSCGSPTKSDVVAQQLGYTDEELAALPPGANLGLGCGNPKAMAALRPGEVVLDLGSGAGIDCFLAAAEVGAVGRVIGVDMTHEMLAKARENARKVRADNVEFRLGEIEYLPVADQAVDVIISNCVVNLSPDKARVFKEAFRVLKPGGRLAISDVVATAELPQSVQQDLKAHASCISGAAFIKDLEGWLRSAGFANIRIEPKQESREFIKDWAPGSKVEDFVVSATIEATKPNVRKCC